jgi:xanthine dehydrogenase small subunit
VSTRASIRFLRRGAIVDLRDVPPMRTVLDYLRLDERSRGTKEGCNEGDCGACTVALGSLRGGRIVYEPVNACILLVGQLDGKELVTVDDLSTDGHLHPVQQALVDTHGSQCGFCTPGFVMSLFTLYQQGGAPAREEIATHVAGNLCRCTGYRPIIDAALVSCKGPAMDRWAREAGAAAATLKTLDDGADVFIGTKDRFIARPARAETLAQLAAENPDATIVSGATDVGLWITKQLRVLPKIILTGGVKPLHETKTAKGHIAIGAAASYAEAARLHTGARLRHGRRQHRQWFAHRRHAADADRTRRHADAAPWRCRARTSARRLLHRLWPPRPEAGRTGLAHRRAEAEGE